MELGRKVRAVAVTGLLTLGALAVSVAPASAGTAPACIDTYGTGHHTSVIVANNCPQGAGYNLRVIWNSAPDGSCFWLPAGQQRRVGGNASYPFINFDKVVTC
jgi:hypothetical protein